MHFILQWIDVIWLPLALAVVSKDQRFWALACILSNMAMMRMLAELMENIGYPHGIIGLSSLPVLSRGMAVYSVFYMVYLLYAHFLRSTGAIFMAASIGVFFTAGFTYVFVMVL